MMLRHFVWTAMLAALLPARVGAQQPYPLHEMNFDMWCQEEKHLPPERCDQRLPQDDAEFETYRATIEKYEIPYLQRKQQEENLTQLNLQDPVDKPVQPSTPENVGGTPPCSGPVTCSVMPAAQQNSGAPADGSSPQQ